MQTQMYRVWKLAFVSYEKAIYMCHPSSWFKKNVIVNIIDPGYKTQMLKYFASQYKPIEEPRLVLKKISACTLIHAHTHTHSHNAFNILPFLRSYNSQTFQFLFYMPIFNRLIFSCLFSLRFLFYMQSVFMCYPNEEMTSFYQPY